MPSVVLPPDLAATQDFGSAYKRVCNIVGYLCDGDLPGGLLVRDRADSFNETLCQADRCYALPVLRGDKFMIQTPLHDYYNSSPVNDESVSEATPGTGFDTAFDLTVYDACTDEAIDQGVSGLTSRHLVGWTGSRSYQLVEIDTSLPSYDGLKQFYFRIRARNQGGQVVEEVFTQDYTFFSERCRSSVLVRSDYPDGTEDCMGYYHGLPKAFAGSGAFRYSNVMRLLGEVVTGQDSFQKEIIGRRRTSVSVESTYELVLGEAVPDWVKNELGRAILAGSPVYFDNRRYFIDQFTSTPNLRFGRMWHFDILATKDCNVNYRCTPDSEPISQGLDLGISQNDCCHPCFG